MITDIKRVDDIGNNKVLTPIESNNVIVYEEAALAIDASTTNTGIGIVRVSDGNPLYIFDIQREKDETHVQYKVRLKKFVCDLLLRNKLIKNIYYEEPFLGYANAALNLIMLKDFIGELIEENNPHFNYINYLEINNKKWKKLFLYPEKCPTSSELEKSKVREKALKLFPYLKDCSQDVIDAVSMGYIAVTKLRKGLEDDLLSKKKPRPFKYDIVFAGSDDDEALFEEFSSIYKGPVEILENGIVFDKLGSRANFEKRIYELMGDEDKVLILKFSSEHHGNIILQHKIGHLAATYPYLYAIVWRKRRKN